MKITILTLFPQMFKGPFDLSIIKRAQEKNLVEINFVDIRDFGIGKHKSVDDTPYGGGHGMILRVDVIKEAIDSIKDQKLNANEQKVVLTSASGQKYTQELASSYSKLKHLVIICGHYEGIDDRIKHFVDEEVSIGEFVLTGGEIPAMVITDSVVRLIEGVLKKGVTEAESFSNKDLLEHEQYTRPDNFEGYKVPEILLSGNHGKVAEWKKQKSAEKTILRKEEQKDY